jgi:hypothetical protein
MSKPEEIKKSIEKIKKQIADPNVPDAIKELLKSKVLPKLEKDLAGSEPAGKTYKEELERQKKTGEAKGEAISLSAMAKNIKKPLDKKTKESLKDYFEKSKEDAEDDSNVTKVSFEQFEKVWKSKKPGNFIFWVGWDQYSYDEFEEMGKGDFKKGLEKFYKDQGLSVDYQMDDDKKTYRIVLEKDETPKAPKSEKRVGVPRPKSEQQEVEYDCDELIKQAKERKAKAKARAEQPKKTEATKNKEKIEKVYDNVKERAESDDITKGELEKLISETKTLLKLLEAKLSSL